jgi:hypothetical protein
MAASGTVTVSERKSITLASGAFGEAIVFFRTKKWEVGIRIAKKTEKAVYWEVKKDGLRLPVNQI